MKHEIDQLLDTEQLKEEFKKNKLFLSAIKSYVKREWKNTYHILRQFHDLEEFKHYKKLGVWWVPNFENNYYFRNRAFRIKDILEVFLREYVKKLISEYKDLCDETGINEHVEKILNL